MSRQLSTKNYLFSTALLVDGAYRVFTRDSKSKNLGLVWADGQKWTAESFWGETLKEGFTTRAAAAKWLRSVWESEKQ